MSEEQLERSILERKASEELRAIATAMSLEPVARSRKADLVNQILRAAGVEVDGDSRARRARRAAASLANGDAAERRRAQHRRRRRRRKADAEAAPPGPGPGPSRQPRPWPVRAERQRADAAHGLDEGHGGRDSADVATVRSSTGASRRR